MSQPEAEPLPEEIDPNEAEIAWAEELRRRVEAVRSGEAKIVSGAEIHAKIEERRARYRGAKG